LLVEKEIGKNSVEEIIENFGGGSCYVYDSLPFSYAFFLRNLGSIDGILEAVNAGGDTDTNAKIVGEMVGARSGIEIFQSPENRWMIEGLREYDQLIELANEFCDCFEIK